MPIEMTSSNLNTVRFLTIHETAERLGVSIETVRRRVNAGELRVIRDGRIIRIHPDDLESYIAARRIR
jgi:excisionase family DNA binding protein